MPRKSEFCYLSQKDMGADRTHLEREGSVMTAKELLDIHRQAAPLASCQNTSDMEYIETLSLICCDWMLYQDKNKKYWSKEVWKL